MTETLPSPESRKESYLAKAAGMDVNIPEKPMSRTEQYLNAIAQGGGGGGTSDFNDLANRPKYNGTAMTGETNIPVAPTVVQTTGTSQTDVMSQDATTSVLGKAKVLTTDDYNYSMSGSGTNDCVAIWLLNAGLYTNPNGVTYKMGTAYGDSNSKKTFLIFEGADALYPKVCLDFDGDSFASRRINYIGVTGSVNRQYLLTTHEVVDNLNSTSPSEPLSAKQGKVLKDLASGETESYTIATADWSALSASSPYTYQATVTATHTIGANTVAELLNDAPVTFATYGFAIGSISGQSVTIYSIGQPSASVTLKVNYKG